MAFNGSNILRLGIPEVWPLSTVSARGNVSGIAYDLWKYLAKSLKLNWTEVKLGQPSFEGKNENGIWGGIFGHLQTKSPEVDILLLDSYAREDRFEDMEFTTPFDFTYTVLVSNLKGECITTTYQLFPEVSGPVVIVTTVILMVVTTIMWLDQLRNSFFNILIIASILRQPVPSEPRSVSGRIALGFLLLGLVPLINTFLCEMRANLASCSESSPETFAQILEEKKLASVSKQSPDMFSLTNSKDISVRTVMEKIGDTKGFLPGDYHDYSSLKKFFIEENRVFITPKQSFINNLHQLCMKEGDTRQLFKILKLKLGSINYFMKCVCLPIRIDFPDQLLEDINKRILIYSEAGLWIYGMERIEKGFIKCMGSNTITGGLDRDKIQLHPVSLSGVVSAYKYWIIGIAVSCYAFVIEMCVYKCSRCTLKIKIIWH